MPQTAILLVHTFRYQFEDKAQSGGQTLKRWWDYLVLRRTYRRGVSGWWVVFGTYDAFGRNACPARYEWRLYLGGRRYWAHRLVVHCKTGLHPGETASWITDHLAGTLQWQQDLEAGWCLSTWQHLVPQRWVAQDGDWEAVSLRQKQSAMQLLRRYRRGNMYT